MISVVRLRPAELLPQVKLHDNERCGKARTPHDGLQDMEGEFYMVYPYFPEGPISWNSR